MTTVRVAAPARLHLGMLDVAGNGTRRFGGLGLAVDRPATVVEVSPAEELSVEGPEAERALAAARRCLEALALPAGARVRVREAIPAHAGLGSGTKLALAVSAALAALHGAAPPPLELARAAGRGARSAVGLWTFALGGFVVEGGRRTGADGPAPLLVRHAMPDAWRCVLIVPEGAPGLSGPAEEEAISELRPEPERSALIAQIVLTALLPALVEHDIDEFGAALTHLQRLVGDAFAPVQGGTFHPRAGGLVEALLRHGAAGAGQSSWGPAVYGIVADAAAGRALMARLEPEIGNAAMELVAFDNQGARTEWR